MLLTASVHVKPPHGSWCSPREEIAMRIEEWSAQVTDEFERDEVRNSLYGLLDCSPPHANVFAESGPKVSGIFISYGWCDPRSDVLVLCVYEDDDGTDSEFNALFDIPLGTPEPTMVQCAFVVLKYDQRDHVTEGVAVLPIGDHIWESYGNLVPQAYKDELAALVS